MVLEKYNPKWVEQFQTLKEFLEKNVTEYISIEQEEKWIKEKIAEKALIYSMIEKSTPSNSSRQCSKF